MFGSGYDSNIHVLVRDTLFETTFAYGLSRVQESCCYGREVLELPFLYTIRLSTGFWQVNSLIFITTSPMKLLWWI
jgi:hypothetical protein